jgi:hypothetical protein
MSDNVESNTNGLPDPENLNFELGISFLSHLQAEICVLPVWVAAILFFGLPVARDTICNSTFEEPDKFFMDLAPNFLFLCVIQAIITVFPFRYTMGPPSWISDFGFGRGAFIMISLTPKTWR